MTDAEMHGRVHQAVGRWAKNLSEDPTIMALVQSEDEMDLIPMEEKFRPVEDAVQNLVDSLGNSQVHPDLISEVAEVLRIMKDLCLRAACSTPSDERTIAVQSPVRPKPRSLGLAIQSTALGRRASYSYRMFDRLGGWETLSAAIDGVYLRLMKDPGMSTFQSEHEQKLKTNMIEIITATLAGKQTSPNTSLWSKHFEVVSELGLPSTFFDKMLEHLQATLDELGLPHDEIHSAIESLKLSRVASLESQDHDETEGHVPHGFRSSLSGKSRLGRVGLPVQDSADA